MAITEQQIFIAADTISASGDTVTLAKVRDLLQGGSFSTISKAMQKWRSQQQAKLVHKSIHCPEELQQQGIAWIERIYHSIHKQTEETVKSQHLTITQLEMESKEKDQRIEHLVDNISQLQQKLSEQTQQKNKAEQQLKEKNEQHREQQIRLQELMAIIDRFAAEYR